MAKIVIIGAGFGGMSAAAYLAKEGHDVTVLEKTSMPGGRAQVFQKDGFTFDAGPSWYMMPDVFDDFFGHFGKKPTDYFALKRLSPAYRVVTEKNEYNISSYPEILDTIQEIDSTAVDKFEQFYESAKKNYATVRSSILDVPMTSWRDAMQPDVLKFLASRDMYQSYAKRIERITTNADLQHILQFMSVFMGGSPKDIPAVYALLAYVDMGLGVFYPDGGFGAVARAFETLCKEQGVTFNYSEPVTSITSRNGKATSVITDKATYDAEIVIGNADYQAVETTLLSENDRSYTDKYWQKADVSPSGLIMLLGINTKLKNLLHHTLFFDTEWDNHFALLKSSQWSVDPLFYLSTPSLSDDSVAPKNSENLFVLAPQAAGVQPTKQQLQETEENIMKRLSKQTGVDIKKHIATKEVLTMDYFVERFSAFKGNAFGLSHTLMQSAVFRPRLQSKKLPNLYYVGQYTNPGTGVPMVVLSGKVVANLVQSHQS